jgi:hypothetical protein
MLRYSRNACDDCKYKQGDECGRGFGRSFGILHCAHKEPRPSHYTSFSVECIAVTAELNFCAGNIVKYVWRSGLKANASRRDDLAKALHYANHAIAIGLVLAFPQTSAIRKIPLSEFPEWKQTIFSALLDRGFIGARDAIKGAL